MHLDYTMRGLRTISRSLLDSLLLDTYNLNCLRDSPETQITCPQDDNSGMVVKCKKTHVVVQAHGILGVEPGNYNVYYCLTCITMEGTVNT